MHVRYATTAMRMPAMSPTMTEGGIASWKVNEGDAFAAGDVLLEIVSARRAGYGAWVGQGSGARGQRCLICAGGEAIGMGAHGRRRTRRRLTSRHRTMVCWARLS